MDLDFRTPEDRVIELLSRLDEVPSMFLDAKLRDWRSSFSRARIWVRFGPGFAAKFDAEFGKATATTAATRAEVAALISIRALLGEQLWLEDIDLEPLSDAGEVDRCPLDAFLSVWVLGKPNEKTLCRANKTSGMPTGKRSNRSAYAKPEGEDDLRTVGGRPGYVIRAPDFYSVSWGLWLKHPDREDLMTFVESLATHSMRNAAEFAAVLNERGFRSSTGTEFDAASVRRLDLARELLLGNKKPCL